MLQQQNRCIIANHLDEFNYIRNAKGEVSVLDIEQVYQFISPLQNKVLGYTRPNTSLVGKTNFDIKAPAVELAEQFHTQCKSVIDQKMSMTFFCSGKFSYDEEINYIYTIARIINPNQTAIGLFVHGERVNKNSDIISAINHLFKKMDQLHNYKTSLIIPNYPGLTKRESECLYWMLRGYSSPRIAEKLCLSSRTVESHFERIKFKYNCASKHELHDYCYEQQLVQILPVS